MSMTYRSVELRSPTDGLWFVILGGRWDGLEVRGEDTVVPGKDGEIERDRVPGARLIRLHGVAFGTSEADWADSRAAMEAIFDETLTSGTLAVSGYLCGTGTASSSISARVDSVTTLDRVDELVTEYDITLRAIGDPPDWVDVAAGS